MASPKKKERKKKKQKRKGTDLSKGLVHSEAQATTHRKVLYAPWRQSYVSTAAKDENEACVFCAALRTGVSLESLIVFKGETCSVILNKYPYNNGHTMVIPHRHIGDFSNLTEKEFHEIHLLMQKTYRVLQQAYQPHGMNIGMNLGRVGGAGILGHIHYHLVPRWNGDTNFMPVVAQTKVISEGLEETYKKLVALF